MNEMNQIECAAVAAQKLFSSVVGFAGGSLITKYAYKACIGVGKTVDWVNEHPKTTKAVVAAGAVSIGIGAAIAIYNVHRAKRDLEDFVHPARYPLPELDDREIELVVDRNELTFDGRVVDGENKAIIELPQMILGLNLTRVNERWFMWFRRLVAKAYLNRDEVERIVAHRAAFHNHTLAEDEEVDDYRITPHTGVSPRYREELGVVRIAKFVDQSEEYVMYDLNVLQSLCSCYMYGTIKDDAILHSFIFRTPYSSISAVRFPNVARGCIRLYRFWEARSSNTWLPGD